MYRTSPLAAASLAKEVKGRIVSSTEIGRAGGTLLLQVL